MKKILNLVTIIIFIFSTVANAESFKDYSEGLKSMKEETNTYNCMKIMKNIDSIKISNINREKLKQKIAINLLNIGKMSEFNDSLSGYTDSNELTKQIKQNLEIYKKGNYSINSCNQIYQYIINKNLM